MAQVRPVLKKAHNYQSDMTIPSEKIIPFYDTVKLNALGVSTKIFQNLADDFKLKNISSKAPHRNAALFADTVIKISIFEIQYHNLIYTAQPIIEINEDGQNARMSTMVSLNETIEANKGDLKQYKAKQEKIADLCCNAMADFYQDMLEKNFKFEAEKTKAFNIWSMGVNDKNLFHLTRQENWEEQTDTHKYYEKLYNQNKAFVTSIDNPKLTQDLYASGETNQPLTTKAIWVLNHKSTTQLNATGLICDLPGERNMAQIAVNQISPFIIR